MPCEQGQCWSSFVTVLLFVLCNLLGGFLLMKGGFFANVVKPNRQAKYIFHVWISYRSQILHRNLDLFLIKALGFYKIWYAHIIVHIFFGSVITIILNIPNYSLIKWKVIIIQMSSIDPSCVYQSLISLGYFFPFLIPWITVLLLTLWIT